MQFGTVIQFYPGKGFGFIRPDFGPDVFFHVSALGACVPHGELEAGRMVKYELAPARPPAPSTTAGGKSRARDIEEDRPEARWVEPIDAESMSHGGNSQGEHKRSAAPARRLPSEQQSTRHPRARQKKPSWRR